MPTISFKLHDRLPEGAVMEVRTYGEFSQSVHGRHSGQRAPLSVSIEITRRCPLECLHCYNNLPMSDFEARRRELSKDEHFRLLDELGEMGCLWLLYTGGEIFARKDFLEIYTYAKQKGFLITLFTNGTLITEKVADYLQHWPPFAIEITLYGRSMETYEGLTRIEGSYERCMRGVALLRERGLPLKLKTVPTTLNKHEVVAMKEFAEQELHLEFKFDALVNPRIDCSQSPLGVRLSPEEVVALDLHWPKIAAEHRESAKRELERTSHPAEDGTVYSCGGGVNSFAIDPYGHMSICVLSHQDTYDIRSGSMREGWEQFLLKVRAKERKRISKCVKCRIHSLCSMCPANGELENNDPESPVEFLCEVAHLRAAALGLEVPAHGECEFCPGGRQYGSVQESARRILSNDINVNEWTSPNVLLPILNNRPPASYGGCGGCGEQS